MRLPSRSASRCGMFQVRPRGMPLRRRDFLRASAILAASAGSSLWAKAALASGRIVAGPSPLGPLRPADENGLMLPAGMRSRVVARSGEKVPGSDYVWHRDPDGGAIFGAERGFVYVSNSESNSHGGVGAIRFADDASIQDAYPICNGTRANCAGGSTPWQTWLSCEEFPAGHVWECDPLGRRKARLRNALGTFKHEAVAVDSVNRYLYLTEDESDGRLYRFTPARWGELVEGLLEVAEVAPNDVLSWHRVPNPNPRIPSETPTRHQVAQSTPFRGGEGIIHQQGHVYFTTKYDNRVWDYDTASGRLRVLYDAALDPGRQLTGVDNAAPTPGGDVLVAEDGGNMELVLLSAAGVAAPLLRLTGQSDSELTGPAFDPSGTRLYFSSQRGGRSGITYEVTDSERRFGANAPTGRPT